MIPKETIHNVIETSRIEEVVGDFVTLKKRGANMLGLCPFHNEKTPSFTVSPAKGIYKCFGCGEGGNSLNFIMNHEHYTYPEAIRYLASKYSIEIEEEELTPEKQQELNEKESMFIVSAFAEKFFEEQLHDSNEGKAIGLSYFKERGFTEETIRKFKLGYSPDKWDSFTSSALENGYGLEFLVKTGLTKERNGQNYDGYRGRVIFPIHNLSGRPIGFGGRTLKTDKKTPKYVNSPECEIYNKRRVLYGLNFAKKSIVKEDSCYLVEGYTDVISLAQTGVENVVSSSGTSLTTDQIRLIGRYTKNIHILYDGDTAGIKASFRGIDLILEEGMNVKVVLFPEGEDPDSFAKTHESDEVHSFIKENAKDFIVFKTDLLFEETQGDPIKKTQLVKEIVHSIALIPDFIARSVYLKECSSMLDVPEAALISELNKVRASKAKKDNKRDSDPMPDPGFPAEDAFMAAQPKPGATYLDASPQETDLIRLILHYGDHLINLKVTGEEGKEEWVNVQTADYIVNEIFRDGIRLESEIFQYILEEFHHFRKENVVWSQHHFTGHSNPEVCKACIDLLSSKYELHDWESREIFVQGEERKLLKAVQGAVYSYKAKRLGQMSDQNQKQIQQAHSKGEDFMELMAYQKILDDIKKQISAHQGRTILH